MINWKANLRFLRTTQLALLNLNMPPIGLVLDGILALTQNRADQTFSGVCVNCLGKSSDHVLKSYKYDEKTQLIPYTNHKNHHQLFCNTCFNKVVSTLEAHHILDARDYTPPLGFCRRLYLELLVYSYLELDSQFSIFGSSAVKPNQIKVSWLDYTNFEHFIASHIPFGDAYINPTFCEEALDENSIVFTDHAVRDRKVSPMDCFTIINSTPHYNVIDITCRVKYRVSGINPLTKNVEELNFLTPQDAIQYVIAVEDTYEKLQSRLP